MSMPDLAIPRLLRLSTRVLDIMVVALFFSVLA